MGKKKKSPVNWTEVLIQTATGTVAGVISGLITWLITKQ